MVQNRLLRHTLFIFLVMAVLSVAPQISEAQTTLELPTNASEITLSIPQILDEKPLVINIPNLGIDLKIDESPVENGTWKVPDDAVGYAEGSAPLDEEH